MLCLSLIVQRQGDQLVRPAFQFHIISADLDDNKFCDCALAANADYVVTEDAYFVCSFGQIPRRTH